MKKSVVTYIFIYLGVAIALGYLVFAGIAFRINENKIRCKELEVIISGKVRLIDEVEIAQTLADINLHPEGVPVNQLNTDEIERFLEQNPIISKATCFRSPNGRVFLHVFLREPKFLVVGNDTYYVDTERNILPVPKTVVAYVPVVTGRVTKSMATGKLYDLVEFISGNEFWNAQISQIHLNEKAEVELVPRVGNTLILLGKPVDFEPRFERLYELYTKGFAVFGWDIYRQLDLRYDNQIVGVRNPLQAIKTEKRQPVEMINETN